jgi:hypothetical protein
VGGGHRPRVAGDIAADDQDGSDLRDRPAEPGEDGGDQLEPRHRQQVGNRLQASGPVDLECGAVFGPQIGRRGMHECGYDRQRQHALRQYHGAGRKQQAERAERARPGEEQVERQTDDHRGKSEKGIGRDHQDSPTRDGAGGKSRPERRAQQGGECGGRQADPERKKDDPPEALRIEDRPEIRDGHGLAKVLRCNRRCRRHRPSYDRSTAWQSRLRGAPSG